MFRAVGARLAVLGADMGAAFRLRPVRIGLLGTILLALGSLSPAYLPQASPYWPTMRALGLDTWLARALATVMVIGAVGLLIFAWYRLRPAVYRDVKHWAVLAWWSIPCSVAWSYPGRRTTRRSSSKPADHGPLACRRRSNPRQRASPPPYGRWAW